MKKSQSSINFFKLNIFSSSELRLLEILQKRLNDQEFSVIFTPNPEQIVLSGEDEHFLKILQTADLLIPDGIGLVWATKILTLFKKTASISTRIAGRELVVDLLDIAKNRKLKVLVIGGRDYQKLKIKNAKYQHIYFLEAYEDFAKASREEENFVVKTIRDLRPDIVFVALGAPKQEFWIDSHKELLEKSGVKIAMSVGGSFDYLLGKVKRTPKIVSDLGFEWLFRLITQPFRWKRQLKLIKFIKIVFKELISG